MAPIDISHEDQQRAFGLRDNLAKIEAAFREIHHPEAALIHEIVGLLRQEFFWQMDARRRLVTSPRMERAVAAFMSCFCNEEPLLYVVMDVKAALSELLAYRETDRPSPDELEEESRNLLASCIRLFDYYVHHLQHAGDPTERGGKCVMRVLNAVLAHKIYKDEAAGIQRLIERIREKRFTLAIGEVI
ncbi:MAG: hypothetical protein PHE68_04340 [Candidatus Peribacteraceae bacterium]|nr:hypothetical protein [Candidatus Peribacteraceae bacterium]MDD5075135.1 hypothetical protein [Candidatus Peribacteraceae bacterium]